MKLHVIIFFLTWFQSISFAQEKFQIVFQNEDYETYYIATEKGEIIKKLDSTYHLAFQPETTGYFHVFAIEGKKDWCAIDINGKILFNVYNTEVGTPSPDELVNDQIRVIENGKVGFADEKGVIVIQPQFEIATSFKNGYAIIGESCEKIPWDKDVHENETCEHYSIVCKKHGYIDSTGKIIEFGEFTFEEISKTIGWEIE